MKYYIINTGYFYADGGVMFGAIPKAAWKKRYDAGDANDCRLVMRSLLVLADDGRVILVDAGVGTKQLKKLASYKFSGLLDLRQGLLQLGVKAEAVTDVVLTHLHFDHCGSVTLKDEETGELSLSFPHARHWVSRAQWENFLSPHPLEKDSYFLEDMMPVEEAGLLQLVEADCEMGSSGVSLRLYDGHTPGQLVPYIAAPDKTVVFPGDVVPLAAHCSPAWISAYDTSPLISYHEKIRLLEEAVDKGQQLIFCHDAYTPQTFIRRAGKYYSLYGNF
ncbi:MAG: MBL fold metallo-hydrolase [Tannerellaceae bacterium]|jgi:glyoxylase-like metal-dependent hydrolase (beta-lactamase superfamily II)|nr:MBL fold metallo-hydrolase [Tannerellaceae bacterium]